MKREIKFRAQKSHNSETVYFDLKYFLENDDDKMPDGMQYVLKNINQFTGLKDKNGVDIYEGDKFKSCVKEIDFYEVFYGNGSFKMRYKTRDTLFTWGNLSRCLELLKRENLNEIIGNIYENPELLKP